MKFIIVFLFGILIGMLFGLYLVETSVEMTPYLMKSTRIDLVERGFAEWVVNDKGEPEFKIGSTCEE